MKIRYKRRRLRWNLIFGLFWIILGVISTSNNPDNYLNYGYLIAGSLYIINYLLKSTNQYLTIDNDMISLNNIFPKQILLKDLERIEKFSNGYILQSDKSEIKIEFRLIEKNSLKDLKKIIKNLNLKSN